MCCFIMMFKAKTVRYLINQTASLLWIFEEKQSFSQFDNRIWCWLIESLYTQILMSYEHFVFKKFHRRSQESKRATCGDGKPVCTAWSISLIRRYGYQESNSWLIRCVVCRCEPDVIDSGCSHMGGSLSGNS